MAPPPKGNAYKETVCRTASEPIIDFSHLTAAERIELAMQLWDSLSEDEIVTSDAELEIVKRRRAELEADGDPGEDWETVLREIEGHGA